jgi:hypothetical protein
MAGAGGWEVEQQLKRRHIAVQRHTGRHGDELQVNCPLCNDRRGRLYYNPVKRWAWCHNECGRLSQRQFFEAFGLVDFDAASRSEVAELLERQVVGEVNGPRQGPAGIPFPISSAVLAWWHPVSRAYVQSRRVSRTQALKHFLTYVPTCARHKGDYDLTCVSCYCRERIVVPILRVGFIARDVTRQAFLKDKTLPGSKIRTTLYGLERFRGRRAVLVEGVWDYYALEGFLPVLATFGTALSETQLRRLLRRGVEEVVLLWDGDDAGRTAAERVARRIHTQVRVRVAELPDGTDPDELPLSQAQDLVRKAPLVGSLRRTLAKAGVI